MKKRISEQYLGGCEELCRRIGIAGPSCCESCHEDQTDYGMSMLEKQFEDGWYGVCCSVLFAVGDAESKVTP